MTIETRDVEVYREPQETSAVVLWGTNEPAAMVARMGLVSSALAGAIRDKKMSKRIGEREYVFVEGWSMAGAMLGVFPRTASLTEMHTADGTMFGFRASVELVTRDGGVCGGAEAICTRDEERWADREWNQIASMAQTRATAKAYRGSLGFVMQMAGYAPTPAEEMDGIHDRQQPAFAPRSTPAQSDMRDTAPTTTVDWWTYLMATAREQGVKNVQIEALAQPQGTEPLKQAVSRWMNEHTAGDDTASDVAELLKHAAVL